VNQFVLFLESMLYPKVRVSFGLGDLKKMILISDRECSGVPQKITDNELQALLDQNSCQTQKELAQQLGVTQQDISIRLR